MFLETSDNENTMTQNLRDAAEAALTGKFIAIQSYLQKQEKCQVDNLILHLKTTGKRRTKTPKLVKGKKSRKSEQK